MKWSLSELRKFQDTAFTFEEHLELEDVSNRQDVLDVNDIFVKGSIRNNKEEFYVNIDIKANVKMIDSRSGEDVIYPLSVTSVETFDESLEEDEDIEDPTLHPVLHELDLEPVIIELINVSIPEVYSESNELPDSSNTENWNVYSSVEEFEKDQPVDPRLKKLETLFKTDETED